MQGWADADPGADQIGENAPEGKKEIKDGEEGKKEELGKEEWSLQTSKTPFSAYILIKLIAPKP